jgi:hypothetical protein
MQPTILAGAAALLLFCYWSLRRRPPALLRSTDTSAIAALNRAQIALLQETASAGPGARTPAGEGSQAPSQPLAMGPDPGAATPPSLLAHRLERLLAGDGPQRLEAVRAARRWGHSAALPVLRRGLRDVDPAVVLEAARGMERFRGCPLVAAAAAVAAQPPLPRNVSLTR